MRRVAITGPDGLSLLCWSYLPVPLPKIPPGFHIVIWRHDQFITRSERGATFVSALSSN
jgi:hypothetical protein